MRRPYFPPKEGAPLPLSVRVNGRVRFEEVDVMGIVWHGRYVSYVEDARSAFGAKYGLGFKEFRDARVMAPIKKFHIDYRRPLRIGEAFSVEGILHWAEAARMNFEFIIRDADEQITTTGFSVQLLMDPSGEVFIVPPPLFQSFRDRWRAGELE